MANKHQSALKAGPEALKRLAADFTGWSAATRSFRSSFEQVDSCALMLKRVKCA